MFINSKKTLEFQNPETGEVFHIRAGYLGAVPDWVTKLWFFKAAVDDAAVTYVGDTPKAVPPDSGGGKPDSAENQEPVENDKPKAPAKFAK